MITEISVTSNGFMIESTLMHWTLLFTSFCIIQNQVFHDQSDGHDRRSKNPIDAFKIHVENRVFEYSFLKSQRQTYFYAITIWIEERSCPTVILVINIGPTNGTK